MEKTAVHIASDGAIATVTLSNPPVNAANHAIRAGLSAAIERLEADPAIRAVVLKGSNGSFVAGADIREFGLPPKAPALPDVVRQLAATTKPWVAAIDGVALGGGLELALGCGYRVAATGANLGLPEVNLGIIPGAGGTVLLPRIVPADRALDMIAGGKPVTGQRALEIGLVNEIADDPHAAAHGLALRVAEQGTPPSLMWRDAIAPKDIDAFEAQKAKIRAKARGQLSPVAAIEAVERCLSMDADAAFDAERDAFIALRDSQQSAALRHVFFAERAVSRIDGIKGIEPRDVSHIGVLGGGTMGAGIGAACLLAGLRTTIVERDALRADLARARVIETLEGSAARGLLDPSTLQSAKDALTVATTFAPLSEADLIIEAVFEDMDVKKAVFAELDAIVRPDAILASNTSYLDINEIASGTVDPTRVIGLHFFSPAHVMKLLELIVTDHATPDVLATGLALGKRLRKITVPAGVCDGFIGNRIMARYRREADYMLEDGALPEQIDAAMRAVGFPMGVFQMADMAGLDIGWAMRRRQATTREPSERYVDIADRICEIGRLGRKTGRGWYDYTDDPKGKTDPWVTELIVAESARKGIVRREFDADAIMGRILSVMQVEGDALLAEGIAAAPEAIDVVMINGFGFPRWKGGPMFLKDNAEGATL